jgi:LysM repeat protein
MTPTPPPERPAGQSAERPRTRRTLSAATSARQPSVPAAGSRPAPSAPGRDTRGPGVPATGQTSAPRPGGATAPATRPDTGRPSRALVPLRRPAGSLKLKGTDGVLVPGAEPARIVAAAGPAPQAGERPRRRRPRVPIWLIGNVAILLMVAGVFVGPSMARTASASACGWYTVKPGDTVTDISTANHSDPAALRQANHLSSSATLYVGEKLCVPTAWWAQARSAPVVGMDAVVALPRGMFAGEPCTEDRSVVWTIPVSQWAIPPGCFGQIFYPDPNAYLVNGQQIPGFGWCNWWPEALLRDPNALDKPAHSVPRVGAPVFYAPQPGEHVGHYAFVESIGTGANAGWILISEMNMYWRGAGWAKVNYRYIRVDYPGAEYLYDN